MKRIKKALFGITVGFINALFGSGAGTIAVPFFKSQGKTQKEAQAFSVCLILPLSLLSVSLYCYRGYFNLSDALRLLPAYFAGGIPGSFIMKKLSDNFLKKTFSLLMLYLGVRMIFKG